MVNLLLKFTIKEMIPFILELLEYLFLDIKYINDLYNYQSFSFVPNSSSIAEGNTNFVYKNRAIYFEAHFAFNITNIESWSFVTIGTLTNWNLGKLYPVCILNSIGYDLPSLALGVDEDGTLKVYCHHAVTGINNTWFYGSYTKFISIQ